MKNDVRRLLLALIAVTLTLSSTMQAQDRKRGTPPVSTQEKNKLQEMARKSGGHFVLRYQPGKAVYPNVEELAKRSDIVVIGRTLGHRSKLTADGNFIHTDFLVRVQEVVKGETSSSSLTVTMPGGGYRFDDGTYAMVELLGQRLPEDQNTCVFFLSRPKGGDARSYALASESQGFVDLTSGNAQPSSSRPDDAFNVRYKQLSAVDFLRELHKAVPRKENAARK
jgi:hypothetical protein